MLAQCHPYLPSLAIAVFTYQYPRTRRRSGDQRSQLRRKADACSWPCRCGHACPSVSPYPIFFRLVGGVGFGVFVLDNVGTDGRLEDIGQGVGVLAGSPIGANDRDSRTRHLDNCVVSRCGADASNRRLVASSESSSSSFSSHCEMWARSVHAFGAGRARLGAALAVRSDGLALEILDLMDLTIIERLHLTHTLWTCENLTTGVRIASVALATKACCYRSCS